jgi:hypothetical protein
VFQSIDPGQGLLAIRHFGKEYSTNRGYVNPMTSQIGYIRMSVEGAKRLFNEIGAKDKTLKIYDDPKAGGTIHCSHDYWAHHVPFMLDWLEERL